MYIQLNFSCNESWNKMTSSEQGRFCDSCAKNVIDLTDKTDDEIRFLYQQNKGKMCGRIRSTQLGRPLVSTKKMNLAKFCLALFFVFGSLLFSIEGQAQTRHERGGAYTGDITSDSLLREYPKVNNTENGQASENTITNKVNQHRNYLIKGLVTDKETKEALPFVAVYFEHEGMKYGAITDLDGKYQLAVPAFVDPTTPMELKFQHIGYVNLIVQDVQLSTVKNGTLVMDIAMKSEEIMLMGDIMIEDHNIINTDPEKQGETKFDAEDLKRSPY